MDWQKYWEYLSGLYRTTGLMDAVWFSGFQMVSAVHSTSISQAVLEGWPIDRLTSWIGWSDLGFKHGVFKGQSFFFNFGFILILNIIFLSNLFKIVLTHIYSDKNTLIYENCDYENLPWELCPRTVAMRIVSENCGYENSSWELCLWELCLCELTNCVYLNWLYELENTQFT